MLNIYLFQSLFLFLIFGFYLLCKLKSALGVNSFFDSIHESGSNKVILRSITRGCTQKMSLTIPNLNCVVLKLHRFKERWNRWKFGTDERDSERTTFEEQTTERWPYL